jgi:hypothetical protein
MHVEETTVILIPGRIEPPPLEHPRISPGTVSKVIRNAEIAQKNRERYKNTLGYGLNTKNFKPRGHFEKTQWDLSKKPNED